MVGVQRDDYHREFGSPTITGKDNRQRIVYTTGRGIAALASWLGQRGEFCGALLARVSKSGKVQHRPMTEQALLNRLMAPCDQASIPPCLPHDL